MPRFPACVATLLFVGTVLVIPPLACAGTGEKAPERPINEQIARGSDFMHYHPDLRFRRDGMQRYEAGEHVRAFELFQSAARFSDKPAQAMVAEMLWNGRGVAIDRCLAYAWMDVAAERGYPVFLSFRERYWTQLNEAERECVSQRGAAVYAEYGDAVAKERLEHMLRKRRTRFTGSLVGHVHSRLEILVVAQSGLWTRVPKDQVYDRRFWHANEYHAWQDEIWERPPSGLVEVGPIGTAADAETRKPE